MVLNKGDWVDLGDGRVALISAWDEAAGVAVAETPSGGDVERPTSFAQSRWKPLPQDGLRVAAALDRHAIRKLAEDHPVEVLILALRDLSGRGETKAIRNVISPLVIAEDDWERWWRRTQLRLEDDDRIDASRARDKVYQLQSAGGSSLGRSLVPAIQDETRRGRRVADGPQLKRAREHALRKGPRDPGDEALFKAEFDLARDASVDPTARFMAAELGIWLERWTADDAKQTLGDDVLSVDLMRVPQYSSKTLALDWAIERSTDGGSIVYRSAAAAGPPWLVSALAALEPTPGAVRAALMGMLGWSVPGDEDAGSAKLKDDIPTFERRIERVESSLADLTTDGRLGLWDGALHALTSLPKSGKYAQAVVRLRDRTARLAWSAYGGLEAGVRPQLQTLDPMGGDAFAALSRAAPPNGLTHLRTAVVAWYANDPSQQHPNLRLLASLLGEDELLLGLAGAQQIIEKTNLPRIALQLFHDANAARRSDPTAASIVNLAVTAAGDDPAIASALDRLAEEVAEAYIGGTELIAGPITFSKSGWERFGTLVRLRLEEATANEAEAGRIAEEATKEATRLRELAEVRARSLTEARTSAGSETRQDVGRLASNLMKPVALALGDSFEGNSLESLQDRLLSVLQRARIVPIHEVGEVAAFDPAKHQWVGEGAPANRVQARSPGFMIEREGGDGIVLVPARVVGAASP